MKKIMKNTVMLIVAISINAQTEIYPYISPGIMLSWNTQKVTTINFKCSLGYWENNKNYIANITIGKRFFLNENKNIREYIFIEPEINLVTSLLLSGAGLGVAFYKDNNKLKLAPKISLFTGCVAYLRTDMVYYDKKIDTDLGAMLVMPVSPEYFKDHSWNLDLSEN